LVGVTGEASGSRGNDLVSILHFRHLLKPHQLAEQFLLSANAQLSAKGYLLREGSAVDAALIVRPSSTKNQSGERDPETHQTKNGNHWHFGVKMHIGVDADSGLVHFVVGMAANVNDVTQAHALPHGDEADVVSDAGYRGIDKREGAEAEDGWHVAMRTGKCRALDRTTLVGKLANELEGASHAFVPRSNILFTSSSTTSGI
jgi:IS5 family transposase